MNSTCFPFDSAAQSFDYSNKKWIEVQSGSKLYNLLLDHICANPVRENLQSPKSQSFRVSVNAGGSCLNKEKSSKTIGRLTFQAGLGVFTFLDCEGSVLQAIHQTIGDPVGSSCGVDRFTNLVVFTDGSEDDLARFFTELIVNSEKSEAGTFTCYSWHIRHEYWRTQTVCKARPISSVILPDATKQRLLSDIDSFFSADTKAFYGRHGIPYRRSYLFFGVPGAGKTSLIQAIAGHFKRSISYLQPTDPLMTDESLKKAITGLEDDTIVVFEDIDSLFAADRSNKVKTSSLTFSGLLNALDGVGSSNGQIFILTTNLRNQLDPALIRNGRVDMHIEFKYATAEQMQGMWRSYYPQAEEQAEEFSRLLTIALEGRKIAAAGLQHFFVLNMRHTADEALGHVHWVLEDMKQKEEEEEEQLKSANDDDGKAGATSSAEDGDGNEACSASSKSTERHIHIHLHDCSVDQALISRIVKTTLTDVPVEEETATATAPTAV